MSETKNLLADLQEECRTRKLPDSGNKTTLMRRLISAIRQEEGEPKVDDDDEDFASGKEDNGENANGSLSEIAKKESVQFTFKDVEESLQVFTGDDNKNVQKWLENFEESSLVLKWNDMQKFVYGKRLIKGSAQMFIENEAKPKSWASLRTALRTEFGSKINSAVVHRQLSQRKKAADESYRAYIYKMLDIASQADIETSAVIVYIVDGIPGAPKDKLRLYESTTTRELKKRLDIYELVQSKTEETVVAKTHTEKKKSAPVAKRRCYNCGDDKHEASLCPNKSQGPKCFKCNQYGHKSADCPTRNTAEKSNTPNINVLKTNVHKDIKVNNQKVCALFDTGSDITVIREDIFRDKNIGKTFDKSNMAIFGFGSSIHAIGVFDAHIEIDEHEFDVKCYVVPKKNISVEFIVGMNLLSQATMFISSDGIQITKPEEEDETTVNGVWSGMSKCMYISEKEHTLPDLYHIDDKSVTDEIMSLVRGYKPTAVLKPPVELKIILTDDIPVCQQPRRLPYADREAANKQVQEWLENGIIQETTSDYASPIVFAPKKDGSRRLCIDFRQLNRKMVKDKYPLPNIDDQIDMLQKGTIFTTLDLANGFFHVPVEENSRKFTAFVTYNGHYEFLFTPFGLSVGPPVFQRFINKVYSPLINAGILLVFMDDLIILAKSIEEALKRLRMVLELAAKYGLNIKWKKCQFLHRKIEFLGYEIENGRFRAAPSKTRDVQRFPELKTPRQVQQFLGLTGYFRKFIENYALIARPLSDLLRNGRKFEFGENQRRSFESLKQAITQRPVLTIFRYGAETELHTDASKWAFGAILLQRDFDDGKMHPVQYLSIKTSEMEQKYDSYELEVLAVVKAIKKFRVYLLGNPFKIYTDCKAFEATMKKKDVPKISRWALVLQEYDCEVIHRPGSKMQHVDALSRIHLIQEPSILKNLKIAQATDDRIKAILEVLDSKPYDNYVVQNGLLCREFDGNIVIAVPELMEHSIIQKAHDQGHFKFAKMEAIIKKEFYIPKLKSKVLTCVQNCVKCILTEKKAGKQEGLLHTIPKESVPLDTWHMDHLGPLASTNKNYKHVLTVIDAFTKFVWIFPTKSVTSAETVSKLRILTAIFGNPRRIIVDKGGAFIGGDFQDHCSDEDIEVIKITTGVARGNGQVERIHRTIIGSLSKLSIDNPEKWFQYVEPVQKYLNKTYQRSIDTSPFELMIGTPMKTKEDKIIADVIEAELAADYNDNRDILRQKAKQQIQRVQEENRKTYNSSRKEAFQYNVGDLVSIARTQFGSGLKLRAKNYGPYEVIKAKGNDRYDVRKVGDHEGPGNTSTSADLMKRWPVVSTVNVHPRSNEMQDGRL